MATDRGNRLIRNDNSEIPIVAVVSATDTTVGGGASTLPAGTDRSGTITTGGTAQQMAPANPSRLSLTGQNISSGNLGINELGGTAAIGTAGTYTVAAGQGFSIATNRAVSVIGPTTGQAWTATET